MTARASSAVDITKKMVLVRRAFKRKPLILWLQGYGRMVVLINVRCVSVCWVYTYNII